jgi:hypothetical protein
MNTRTLFLWTRDVRERMLTVGTLGPLCEESREGWCAWCKKHAVGQA